MIFEAFSTFFGCFSLDSVLFEEKVADLRPFPKISVMVESEECLVFLCMKMSTSGLQPFETIIFELKYYKQTII